MCNCGKNRVAVLTPPAFKTTAFGFVASNPNTKPGTETVYVTSTKMGWFTTDSGNRYKSYGKGTKWVIAEGDRPSLERMELIEKVPTG